MKLMEFIAMGLPVIAPDLPPIREVLDDRRTGRIFRNGDMNDMLNVLLEMLADPGACRTMGQAARAHVLSNLTWDAHARHCIGALSLRPKRHA
jgi:glycosyltransferase involved in cell wall biosynthesis